MIGKVKWFNNDKGYGFIEYKENEDIFVHYSTINIIGYKTLSEGQYVEFTLLETSKGYQAVDVTPIKEPATVRYLVLFIIFHKFYIIFDKKLSSFFKDIMLYYRYKESDNMEIIIRGDKIEVTKAMKDYIKEKLKRLDKYLENSDAVRASVVVRVSSHRQTVEITIPLHNFIIRSEETQEDFYAAVDKAIDVMERQIRKNKTRLKSREDKTRIDFKMIDLTDIEYEEKEDKIIKRKQVEVKPMDEEEAILQMELLGHQFYLFKNIDTSKEAVVYKRKNGGYGLIESL